MKLKRFENFDYEEYKKKEEQKEKEGREKHRKFQEKVKERVKEYDKFITNFNQLSANKTSYALEFDGEWSAPWFITRFHRVFDENKNADYDILFWFDDMMFNGEPYPRAAQFNKKDIEKFIEDKKIKYYKYEN